MIQSFCVFSLILFSWTSVAGWDFDFSRRQKDMVDMEQQREVYKQESKSLLEIVTDRQAPMQDLVLMITKDGFVPEKIQVRSNQRYQVHVINANKQQKNLSFMLDAFSQHHGAYFGMPKTFIIEPRREGLFDFQCPETGAKGHFVVNASDIPIESPLKNIRLRQPASE